MLWWLVTFAVAFGGGLLLLLGVAKSKEAAHDMLNEYGKLLAEARAEQPGPPGEKSEKDQIPTAETTKAERNGARG